jgi:hypothetical protein
MIKCDTYHDTWTNYLMNKNLFSYKTKLMVMDVVVDDKIKMIARRKGGPSRAMLRSILLSVLHV